MPALCRKCLGIEVTKVEKMISSPSNLQVRNKILMASISSVKVSSVLGRIGKGIHSCFTLYFLNCV